ALRNAFQYCDSIFAGFFRYPNLLADGIDVQEELAVRPAILFRERNLHARDEPALVGDDYSPQNNQLADDRGLVGQGWMRHRLVAETLLELAEHPGRLIAM